MADYGTYISTFLKGARQYWPNKKTVTLTVVGPSSNTNYTVANVRSFNVDLRDLPPQRQGIFTKGALQWWFQEQVLPTGIVPKPMDTVTDTNGVIYTLQDLEYQSYNATYYCNGLDLKFALGFNDVLKIQRPTYTNVGGQQKISGYTDLAASIPGLVIETGRVFEEKIGKRATTRNYDIHMQSLYAWHPTDRIVDQNNVIYQIIQSGVPGTIDNYLVYGCEIVS